MTYSLKRQREAVESVAVLGRKAAAARAGVSVSTLDRWRSRERPAAEAPKRMSLCEAVGSGDLRASLVALRDSLAGSIEAADAEKVAPLAKQLRDTLLAVAALPESKEVSLVDELRDKRAARLAGSSVSGGSAGQVVGGSGRGGVGRQRGAGS